ncbi:YolD-like family protein [Ectobacillus sp. sgz5001026]|uniref:YolD-like family protein n=1 Tax=Ectobacillus sp. sgz5001026 TaxID=3242473 RepID=UPI0036D219A6
MKLINENWEIGTFEWEEIIQLPKPQEPDEHIEMMLCEAMEHHNFVSFDYRHRGVIFHITGRIHHYNVTNQRLQIIDTAGKARFIYTANVVHIEICKEW